MENVDALLECAVEMGASKRRHPVPERVMSAQRPFGEPGRRTVVKLGSLGLGALLAGPALSACASALERSNQGAGGGGGAGRPIKIGYAPWQPYFLGRGGTREKPSSTTARTYCEGSRVPAANSMPHQPG
jgi:hypothetical protein